MPSQFETRMGDKRYVAPRPKYAGPIIGWTALAILALIWYAFAIAQFVPSALAQWTGSVAGVIFAATGVFFALRWKPVSDRPAKWTASPFVGIPLLAFLGLMFGYTAFGIGLPSLYSAFWGVRTDRQAVVAGWNYSRYHCFGPRIEGGPILFANPCMAREVPRGTMLTLQGRQSVMGFEILTIAVH